MVCICSSFYIPNTNYELTTIKQDVKQDVCRTAILLFYILQKYYVYKSAFFQNLLPYIML